MDWKKFESEIFETFTRSYPDASIAYNQKVTGRYSKTERQIERYEQFQGEEMHFFTGKIEKFTKIYKKEDSWKGEKLMPINNVIEIIEKDKENEFRKVQLKFLKNLQNSKNI